MFDVFYIGENSKLKELLPFAKQINAVDEIKAKTRMVWLIEPNIEIIDTDIFNFRPEMYDMKYEHVWKWDSNNYGGIRLLPKTQNDGVKEINKIVCKKSFEILECDTEEIREAQSYWSGLHGYVVNDENKEKLLNLRYDTLKNSSKKQKS